VTLVVDASVAAKWILPEPDSAIAVALREQESELIAPSLIAAEIGNAVWKAARRGNIQPAEAVAGIQAALIWFESLIPIEELRVQALTLALELRHPIYDCFYLALAARERCPLITSDTRLIAAAKAIKNAEVRAL
jgi:predicted nucleic acid-binding protein